jgi:glycosyltransferase involved in cell wall biosynthesis
MFAHIFFIFMAVLQRFNFRTTYSFDHRIAMDVFKSMITTVFSVHEEGITTPTFERKNTSKKIKIGLLTNEIPPVVYGGVATWIVNFIKMFEDNEYFEVYPIFLEHLDTLPQDCYKKYKNIRVISNDEDVKNVFSDIDVCVNNLWIAEETITKIKGLYPSLKIITVCHSLIRMENITNMGSCYTNNFNRQETTFMISDYVVLISQAEENYYNLLGYEDFDTQTRVIYNSYTPKYDEMFDEDKVDVDYSLNNTGYIGRHVPRKRPELPILAVDLLDEDVKVFNMGVDYDKYDNEYWRKLENEYKNNLVIIPFSSNKKDKDYYWENVGVNCITGIYEPFGYTICETIDRGIPVVVSDIDGPKEIIEEVRENVYIYDVDVDNYENDIINISKTLQNVWNTPSELRKFNAKEARKCLDKLRPEKIVLHWEKLFYEVI